MKKHLIAAAVAGALAVPAMAQVTVSGTLDVQAFGELKNKYSVGAASETVKDTGSGNVSSDLVDGFATSELKFDMTEDLGGGMSVSARFSQRMTNTLAARDRYIALNGGFGSFQIGRFNPSITSGYLGISGLGSTGNAGSTYGFVTSGANGVFGDVADGRNNSNFGSLTDDSSFERQDNMIQYSSPNIGGLTAAVGTVMTGQKDSTETAKAKQEQNWVSLAYSAGPISVSAATGERTVQASDGTKDETDQYWVGGSYDLGMAKVHLAYLDRDFKDSYEMNVTSAAVTVPMGAITLNALAYDGEIDLDGDTTNTDLSGYQASLRYALSKRTYLYLITGQSEIQYKAATAEKLKINQTGAGIVHTF